MTLLQHILAAVEILAAWLTVAWFALTWWSHEAPEDRL